MELPRRPSDMEIRIQLRIKDYAIVTNGRMRNIDCGTYKAVERTPRMYSEGQATDMVFHTKGKLEKYEYSDFIIAIQHTAQQPPSLSEPVATVEQRFNEESRGLDKPQDSLEPQDEI